MCVLVATGAALSALSGCGSAGVTGNVLENAVEDVERTTSPIEPSTTTPDAGTTAPPVADATQDELVADLRDTDLLPNVSRRDAACVVTGLRARFGDDVASEVLEAATGEYSLDPDEAQEATEVVLGCINVRAWMRTDAMRGFGASSTEGDCILAGWTDGELEGLFATNFVVFDELDDTQLGLTRRLLSETGRCLPEAKLKKLLITSAMAAPSTSFDQATCYADSRVKASGAAEAVRIEFSGLVTPAEASSVFDSLNACLDVRAQFAHGLEQEGYSSEDAACVAHELTDRDLRAIVMEVLVGEPIGHEGDLAFDHFDDADITCGAGNPGT